MVVDFYPRERIQAIWDEVKPDGHELNKRVADEFGYTVYQTYIATDFIFREMKENND